MGLIALIGRVTGVELVLFPGLAALSHDIMKRPRGTWARPPWMLVATPVFTAVMGTLITRHLGYDAVPVMLDSGDGAAMGWGAAGVRSGAGSGR
ncbi:MAG: hypothetical protein EPN49_06865 [Rhodanobacter sp.]|nr:MAG: hypothetical protein EPN49_06865 [Rhodanobacter sp.]